MMNANLMSWIIADSLITVGIINSEDLDFTTEIEEELEARS